MTDRRPVSAPSRGLDSGATVDDRSGRGERVASPCIGLCVLDQSELCRGCRRTPEEIGAWGSLSNDERRQVLAMVAERPPAAD